MQTVLISITQFLKTALFTQANQFISLAVVDDGTVYSTVFVKTSFFLLDQLLDTAACTLVGFAIPKVCKYLVALTVANKNLSSTKNPYQS